MKIQRTTFLELVTALASGSALASGCAGGHGDAPPVIVPVEPKPDLARPDGPRGVPIAAIDAGARGLSNDAPGVGPSGGIWGDAFADAAPKSCAQIRCPTGPTGEGVDAMRASCRAVERSLRPELFSRFMSCMLAHNGTESVCGVELIGTEPGECLERWSEPPSNDPATEAKCRPLVKACAGSGRSQYAGGPISLEACEGILSVTKPQGERRMIHCITEYCDDAPKLCAVLY